MIYYAVVEQLLEPDGLIKKIDLPDAQGNEFYYLRISPPRVLEVGLEISVVITGKGNRSKRKWRMGWSGGHVVEMPLGTAVLGLESVYVKLSTPDYETKRQVFAQTYQVLSDLAVPDLSNLILCYGGQISNDMEFIVSSKAQVVTKTLSEL
jgi:hypothetical protein